MGGVGVWERGRGERRKNGRSRCMGEREGRGGWKGKPAPEGLRI